MDDRIVQKLMGFGLERLKKAKGVVDPSDPNVPDLDEAISRLDGARGRNLSRAGLEGDIGKLRDAGKSREAEVYTQAAEKLRAGLDSPMPSRTDQEQENVVADAPRRSREQASGEQDMARQNYEQAGRGMAGTVARQAKGTAASMAGWVPALVPAAEAAREFADMGGPIDKSKLLSPGAPIEALRYLAKQLPREGGTAKYIGESPSPLAAHALPMLAGGLQGLKVPVVNQLTRAAAAPANALFRTNEAILGRLPGGLLPAGSGRNQIAAGGATALEMAGAEAAIRRAPEALDSEDRGPRSIGQAPTVTGPLQPGRELVLPTVAGAALTLPAAARTGAYKMATNPETELGVVANEYARNVKAGTYKNELAGKPHGRPGIKDVREEGRARVDDAKRMARQEFENQKPVRMAPLKMEELRHEEQIRETIEAAKRQAGQEFDRLKPTRLVPLKNRELSEEESIRARVSEAKRNADLEVERLKPARMAPIEDEARRGSERIKESELAADASANVERGMAARDVAPLVQKRLELQRASNREDLDRRLKLVASEGNQIPAVETREALRSFVASKARSGTGGTPEEMHTPEGEAFKKLENEFGKFMGSGGTLDDWLNIIRWVTSQEKGSPATSHIYRQMREIIRHGMKLPDGTVVGGLATAEPRVGSAWEDFRIRETSLERKADSLYGQPDLDKLPLQSAHGQLDVPLPGDPFTPNSLMPGQEARLRQRLMQADSTSASAQARAPEFEELSRPEMGFAPEIGAMRGKLEGIETGRRARLGEIGNEKASLEAQIAQRKAEIERKLREESAGPVSAAEAEASRRRIDLEARIAQERADITRQLQEETHAPVATAEAEASRRRIGLEAQIAQRKAEITRQLHAETNAPVDAASAEAKRLTLAKEVQEASRSPSLRSMVNPLTLASIGVSSGSRHGLSLLAHGIGRASAPWLQPWASRAAVRGAPESGAPKSFAGLLSLQTAITRKKPEDQAADLVKMARGNQGKLRASIADILKTKEE